MSSEVFPNGMKTGPEQTNLISYSHTDSLLETSPTNLESYSTLSSSNSNNTNFISNNSNNNSNINSNNNIDTTTFNNLNTMNINTNKLNLEQNSEWIIDGSSFEPKSTENSIFQPLQDELGKEFLRNDFNLQPISQTQDKILENVLHSNRAQSTIEGTDAYSYREKIDSQSMEQVQFFKETPLQHQLHHNSQNFQNFQNIHPSEGIHAESHFVQEDTPSHSTSHSENPSFSSHSISDSNLLELNQDLNITKNGDDIHIEDRIQSQFFTKEATSISDGTSNNNMNPAFLKSNLKNNEIPTERIQFAEPKLAPTQNQILFQNLSQIQSNPSVHSLPNLPNPNQFNQVPTSIPKQSIASQLNTASINVSGMQIHPNMNSIMRKDMGKFNQLKVAVLKANQENELSQSKDSPMSAKETEMWDKVDKMDEEDDYKKSDYDEQLDMDKDEEYGEFDRTESEKTDPKYIVEKNPLNMNIKLKHKTRLEPFQNYFPEKVYMPIIYQISLKVLSMQAFPHSTMFVRFAVVGADNSDYVISRKMRSKNTISDSTEETILAGEKEGTIVRDNDFNGYENSEYSICYKGLFKIKFSDSSFYYDQKDFRLRVTIFEQSDLNKEICRILSRPFKIFARKPSKEASTFNQPRLKFMKESRKRKAAENDFQIPTIDIRNRPVKLRKLRYQDHASPISAMVDETLTGKVRDLVSYINTIQDIDKKKYAQKISLQCIYEIDDQNGLVIAKSIIGEPTTPN